MVCNIFHIELLSCMTHIICSSITLHFVHTLHKNFNPTSNRMSVYDQREQDAPRQRKNAVRWSLYENSQFRRILMIQLNWITNALRNYLGTISRLKQPLCENNNRTNIYSYCVNSRPINTNKTEWNRHVSIVPIT